MLSDRPRKEPAVRRRALIAVTLVLTFVPAPSPATAVTVVPDWVLMPSPDATPLRNKLSDVTAVSPVDAWSVGSWWDGLPPLDHPLIQHWDVTDWRNVTLPAGADPDAANALYSVDSTSARDIWAVGTSESDDGIVRTLIQHYDGAAWSTVASPSPASGGGLSAVDMISADEGWAVGSTATLQPLILRRHGGRWSQVAAPKMAGSIVQLNAVSARAVNDVWAVGSVQGVSGPMTPLILHWDGVRWLQVAAPAGSLGNTLTAVSALGAGEVWAVGCVCDWSTVPSDSTALALHLTGGVWRVVPTAGGIGIQFRDVVALSPNDVWTVGYDGASGVDTDHIEHWTARRSLWTVRPVPRAGSPTSPQPCPRWRLCPRRAASGPWAGRPPMWRAWPSTPGYAAGFPRPEGR
jgi:hypothetical protein